MTVCQVFQIQGPRLISRNRLAQSIYLTALIVFRSTLQTSCTSPFSPIEHILVFSRDQGVWVDRDDQALDVAWESKPAEVSVSVHVRVQYQRFLQHLDRTNCRELAQSPSRELKDLAILVGHEEHSVLQVVRGHPTKEDRHLEQAWHTMGCTSSHVIFQQCCCNTSAVREC